MIDRDELYSLVPHRGKMFLLSRILEFNSVEYSAQAEYDVREDCLFYDPAIGGVPSWVCIEFAAQVVSAVFGLKRREIGKEPRLGFILSVSMMKTGIPVFNAGSTLAIEVKKINCMDLTYTFDCSAFLDGKNVFKAQITAVDVDDEK